MKRFYTRVINGLQDKGLRELAKTDTAASRAFLKSFGYNAVIKDDDI